MAKRPAIDLMSLTSEHAAPLPEASQRVVVDMPPAQHTKTANLQALAFKVPPEFRKRFKQRAAAADLKLNELLFEALAAWEEREKAPFL
jgi:hypothetical protein